MHKHIMNWVSSCDITGLIKLWNGANTATRLRVQAPTVDRKIHRVGILEQKSS